MSINIGLKGDVKAEASGKRFPGANSGKWMAGPIQLTLHDKIHVKNGKAIFQATCTFTFIGNGPPPQKLSVSGSDGSLGSGLFMPHITVLVLSNDETPKTRTGRLFISHHFKR